MAKKPTKTAGKGKKTNKKETQNKNANKSSKKPKGKDYSKVDKLRTKMLGKFGINSVVKGSDMEKCTFGRISTGSITLDLQIGGGVPVGKMIQVAGNKSVGKSAICDHIIANAQEYIVNWVWTKRENVKGREVVSEEPKEEVNLMCGYIDVENTKDMDWSNRIGVDTDYWMYSVPEGMEEGLEIALEMQKEGVKLIVIDSVDALVPIKEYESEMDESVQMGIKPRLLGEYCRKVTNINNGLVRRGELPCTVIFINQIREKIGGYGNPEYTVGGKAIPFYVCIDLYLRRGDWITIGTGANKEIVGQEIKFKTSKNKTYKPQQTGSFDFYFEETESHKRGSIDNLKEIILEGVAWGVIERAGAWFRYKGDNIGQGAEKTVQFFRENPDVYEKVKEELMTIINVEVENHLKSQEEAEKKKGGSISV